MCFGKSKNYSSPSFSVWVSSYISTKRSNFNIKNVSELHVQSRVVWYCIFPKQEVSEWKETLEESLTGLYYLLCSAYMSGPELPASWAFQAQIKPTEALRWPGSSQKPKTFICKTVINTERWQIIQSKAPIGFQ